MEKSCCFIGHRIVKDKNSTIKIVTEVANKLISHGIYNYIFGSNSDFDQICYNVITKLKQKYPNIIRIKFLCFGETPIDNTKKEMLEKFLNGKIENTICLNVYDKYIKTDTNNKYGKLSYIKRNNAMIDNSNICIFYYNQNYLPDKIHTHNNMIIKQPKSGTKIAYEYAISKHKNIINVFNH